MPSEQQLNKIRNDLISVGFKPARHAGVVKLVRRFVWPFIRPFAFYLLDRIVLLQQDVAKIQNEDIARLASEQLDRIVLLQQDVAKIQNEDIARLASEQLVLRSDVAALKNIYANNRLSEQVAELAQKVYGSPSREQMALLRTDVDAIKARFNDTQTREQIALLRTDVDAIKARFNDTQNQSRHLAITNTKNGLFIGKPGEIITDHIFSGGVWDSHIVTLAQEVSKTSHGIAVDVGAHFGTVTLAFSWLFKEVLSFEPNDFNYRILRGNIALNCIENVRLFNHALYSKEGVLSLGEQSKQEIPISVNVSGDFDGCIANNLGAYLFSEGCDRPFAHLARTLDSFRLSNVSFIKIDVQGADGEVLMGSMDTIRRCRPVVVFEWEEYLSHNFSVSFDALRKWFEGLNYELSPLKVHNEKQIDYVARPRGSGA